MAVQRQRTAEELRAFTEVKEYFQAELTVLGLKSGTKTESEYENSLLYCYYRSMKRVVNVNSIDNKDEVIPVSGWSFEIGMIEIWDDHTKKGFGFEFIDFIINTMPHDFLFIENVMTDEMKQLIMNLRSKYRVYKQAFGGESYIVTKKDLPT